MGRDTVKSCPISSSPGTRAFTVNLRAGAKTNCCTNTKMAVSEIAFSLFDRDKQVLVDWREKTKIIRQQKQRLAAIEGVTPGELIFLRCR